MKKIAVMWVLFTLTVILIATVLTLVQYLRSEKVESLSWPNNAITDLTDYQPCDPHEAENDFLGKGGGRTAADFNDLPGLGVASCNLLDTINAAVNGQATAQDVQDVQRDYVDRLVNASKDGTFDYHVAVTDLETIQFWIDAAQQNPIPETYSIDDTQVNCQGKNVGTLIACNFDFKVTTPDYTAYVYYRQGAITFLYSDKEVVRACDADVDFFTPDNYQQIWYCPVTNIQQFSPDGRQYRYITNDLLTNEYWWDTGL